MSLDDDLRELGLRDLAANLDDFLAQATKTRLTPVQLLERLHGLESRERSRRSLERRKTRSKVGSFKPMADFDWSWPDQIDRDTIESALSLEFLPEARNIVLVAAQGLGKTMIAQNIAHQAIAAGHSTLFTTASKLLLDLGSIDSSRALDRRFKHYSRFQLLCIDELGYLSYDNRSADLLFEVVNRRYESKSLILTTNLAFSQWPTIFPSATCTTALIDRIIHHADIIAIEGQSYRRRDAETHKKSRRRRK